MFTSLLRDMIKGTEQPDEEIPIGQNLGGSQVQERLSLQNLSPSPSWYMDVFTNLETLRSPHLRDLFGGVIM